MLTRADAREAIHGAYKYSQGALFDGKYVLLEESGIPKLAGWFHEIQQNMDFAGVGVIKNVSDCDDIAATAVALRRMLPAPFSPLAVKQLVQIPGGNYHMDTAWATNNGWYVIEPQDGQTWRLEDYPNTIIRAYY